MPIIINDSVVFGSRSGMLYVLDAQSGIEQWSTNVGSSIVAGNGPTSGLGIGGSITPSLSRYPRNQSGLFRAQRGVCARPTPPRAR